MTQSNPRESRAAKPKKASLLRVVYVSLAVRPLSAKDLDVLGRCCRQRNAAAGITGLLVAQDPYFYGIMEGPSARLLAQMEVIFTDPRHRCLRVLREDPIAERRFTNWQLSHLPTQQVGHTRDVRSAGFIFDLARRLSPASDSMTIGC